MTAPAAKLPLRLEPLDGIRFIAALFVALFHGPKFPGEYVVPYFYLGWDMLFFGSGVVMVFFVISGICIHYPVAASDRRLDIVPFLIRRYIRILPPVLLASLFAWLVGLNYSPVGGRITWSLLCELGYYTMYPFLLGAANRVGWGPVTLLTIPLSYAIQIWHLGEGSPVSAGVAMIFHYLPCWVCGCWVAEALVRRFRSGAGVAAPPPWGIWLWRFGIIAFYSTAAGLSYYEVLYYGWSMVPFSLLVAVWLYWEIQFFRARRPWRWLSWLGLFSYTLYLVHEIAHHGFGAWQRTIPGLDEWFRSGAGPIALRFVIVYLLTAVLTYVFARWVEWPCQDVARFAARKVKARRTPAQQVPAPPSPESE